jgi:Predicted signal transduction protein
MTSFRRKLAQEEASYKLIQNKFLNELCVHALLTQLIKIEELSFKLGYSERATFERAFKQKFGITPSQFRELSMIGNNKGNRQNIIKIAQNMPPMPDSCQQLLREKDQNNLDISRIVLIIEKDPIFVGRIMGLASRAIYGKTPSNVQEAISRNLGMNTVLNLAVMYAISDALQGQVNQAVIEQYTQAFLMAPKLFKLVRQSLKGVVKFDISVTEQLLIFSLLGIFLLNHREAHQHKLILHSIQGIDNLPLLNTHINDIMQISIFSASALMLSLWHVDAKVIKQLTHLDKFSQKKVKGTPQDEVVLFMLSCLYSSARRNSDYTELEEAAALLNISDFSDIQTLLF